MPSAWAAPRRINARQTRPFTALWESCDSVRPEHALGERARLLTENEAGSNPAAGANLRSASKAGHSPFMLGNAGSNSVGRPRHARVVQLEEHLITNQRACRF